VIPFSGRHFYWFWPSESTRSEAPQSRLCLEYEGFTEGAIYSLNAMQDQYALKEFLSAAVISLKREVAASA
jgi:hypothetical protein